MTGSKKCTPAAMLVILLAAAMNPTAVRGSDGAADAPDAAADQEAQPEQVGLTPKFQSGQESRYGLWSRTRIHNEVEFNGQQQAQQAQIISEGEVEWTIETVEGDGSATCRLTVGWLAVEMTGPDGRTRRNDTRNGRGDDEELLALLRAVTGQPLRVRMTADGRVDGIDGLDAIRRRMGEAVAGAEEAEGFIDFSEMAATLATLPGAPAAAEPGDTWQDRRSRRVEPGRIELELDYELAGIEAIADIPIATVQVRGDGRLEVDRARLERAGPGVSIVLEDLEHDGQVMFDLLRGEVVGSHLNTRYTLDTRREGREMTLRMRQQVEQQSQVLRIDEVDP